MKDGGSSEYTTTGVRFKPGEDAYSLHDPVSITQRSHEIVGSIPKGGYRPNIV